MGVGMKEMGEWERCCEEWEGVPVEGGDVLGVEERYWTPRGRI